LAALKVFQASMQAEKKQVLRFHQRLDFHLDYFANFA